MSLAADKSAAEGRWVSFSEFEEKRREWAATDCFRNPGPIQFDAMTRPVSLVADTAGMDELTTKVATMCDQIKDSLVGASAEYLHTAEVSLATLQKVLAIVGKHEPALEVWASAHTVDCGQP
jgi:hypothetical protein